MARGAARSAERVGREALPFLLRLDRDGLERWTEREVARAVGSRRNGEEEPIGGRWRDEPISDTVDRDVQLYGA